MNGEPRQQAACCPIPQESPLSRLSEVDRELSTVSLNLHSGVAAPMCAVGCSRTWPECDRTDIPVEVVARVLEAEMEYLVERGIAHEEQ
jgi:hypothetical protein